LNGHNLNYCVRGLTHTMFTPFRFDGIARSTKNTLNTIV